MKARSLGLPVLAMSLLLSASPAVFADDEGNELAPLRDFWSVNAGLAYAWQDNPIREFNLGDSALYVGATWGTGPDFLPDWMGVELEGGLAASDGEYLGSRWSLYSGAAYLSAYMGREDLYFKLRGGLAYNRADVEGYTDGDSGLAGSIGLGFQIADQPLEINFTAVDRNINTLMLHWRF